MNNDADTLSPLQELIMELCEGNPGAINVMCSLAKTFPPELVHMLLLECQKAGIKGSEFWVIYKDECGQDLKKTWENLLGRCK